MKKRLYQKPNIPLQVLEFPIPNSVAIIQPYVFPYIGYFQLLYSVEYVVFYDDVNFIKRGWINRNRILMNHSDFMFSVPLEKASQNKLINQTFVLDDQLFKKNFLMQLKFAYSKAPFYNEISELIESVFEHKIKTIADLAIISILKVFSYLDIDLKWMNSSQQFSESKGQERADRLIGITKKLGCNTYFNPIGGKELYQKEYFKSKGIDLGFIQTGEIKYTQLNNEFIPYLSIIDVLMFNDKNEVKNLLNHFEIT